MQGIQPALRILSVCAVSGGGREGEERDRGEREREREREGEREREELDRLLLTNFEHSGESTSET